MTAAPVARTRWAGRVHWSARGPGLIRSWGLHRVLAIAHRRRAVPSGGRACVAASVRTDLGLDTGRSAGRISSRETVGGRKAMIRPSYLTAIRSAAHRSLRALRTPSAPPRDARRLDRVPPSGEAVRGGPNYAVAKSKPGHHATPDHPNSWPCRGARPPRQGMSVRRVAGSRSAVGGRAW